jgi:predicted pyridoxine 5'-phosphate oxidase superfamily flavin-nucleotide-binding protein
MPWSSPLPLIDDEARDIRLTAMTADVLPDAATAFGQRVRTRLQNDTVIWIVTVGADGRPQPNPVGFCRDGDDDHPLIQVFGSIAKFSESYPIALRVTITGVRGFYVRG